MGDVDVLTLLPDRLREQPLSDREVVLSYPDVLAAIEILANNGVGFLGWEGWAKYPHGTGHSREYPGIDLEWTGSEAWPTFVTRSAAAYRASIVQDWHHWIAHPPAERLPYVCVTGVVEDWSGWRA